MISSGCYCVSVGKVTHTNKRRRCVHCSQGCSPTPSNQTKGILLSVFFCSHTITSPPSEKSFSSFGSGLPQKNESFSSLERYQENSYIFKTKHFTYVSPFQSLSVTPDQREPGMRHTPVSGQPGKKLVNIMSYNLPRSQPLLGGSNSPLP